MATPVSGMYYSDLPVGEMEDVSPDLYEAIPNQTPYANTIGLESAAEAYSLDHVYYDDAYVDLRTTLNGAITALATTIVLAAAIAQTGERWEIDGEVVILGTNPSGDGVTWVGCTRSAGTVAAAAHASGVPCINMGVPQPQGVAAGDGSVDYEPRAKHAYMQEFVEVIEVPFASMKIRLHGREGTPYDRRARSLLARMKLKVEQSMLKGVAVAPVGSTGTAGAMQGLIEAVIGTNTTACGGSDFTQAILRDAVEDIELYYDPELERNAVLLCPIRQLFVFDGWQQAHIEMAPSDPLVQTYGVHCRRVRIGPMLIDCIPYQRLNSTSVLYQPQYIKPLFYEKPRHEKLGLEGTAYRGQLYCCAGVENNCPEGQYTFTGLRTA